MQDFEEFRSIFTQFFDWDTMVEDKDLVTYHKCQFKYVFDQIPNGARFDTITLDKKNPGKARTIQIADLEIEIKKKEEESKEEIKS